MEKQEQRILEALLGVILIVLLIMMIFLFTLPSGFISSSTEGTPLGAVSTTTITDSFNTNNYYNTQQRYTPTYYKKTNYDYLDYDYHAYKENKKGIFGNQIEDYTVHVKNQDYKGGYFKVNYYFTDYYGDTKSEAITHYIKPRQSKKFTYKNIYKDKYKYHDWDYQVTSKTRV